MAKNQSGFSLIELLVYTAIFAVSSVFLIAILGTITRIQTRQVAVNEVNQQISFVGTAIQKLVRDSSLVNITAGIPTSTLVLEMASSSASPTKVYVSSSLLYVEQGTSTIFTLTDSNVIVDNFTVTKYENTGGGFSVVQVDLTLSSNTSSTRDKVTRVLKSAIGRISAATFDSSINPNTDNSLDVGTAQTRWKNAYFAGNLQVDGRVGIGTTPPSGNFRMKSTGDIGFSTSTYGIVLTAPNGTSCYRLGVTNSGGITTTTATCP